MAADKSDIILLVNAVRDDVPEKDPVFVKDRHSCVLYYRAAALETFPIDSGPPEFKPVKPSRDKTEDKPEDKPEYKPVFWENGVWGTSLCNTICSSLSTILSYRCKCGTETDHSVRSRSPIRIFT